MGPTGPSAAAPLQSSKTNPGDMRVKCKPGQLSCTFWANLSTFEIVSTKWYIRRNDADGEYLLNFGVTDFPVFAYTFTAPGTYYVLAVGEYPGGAQQSSDTIFTIQ